MPGNPTLKKRSLCDLVCEEIQRSILRGQYRPGDRLPSEDRLCEIYSVGRGSIREALKRLEMVGLINIVHGRGVEVAEGNSLERRLRVLETNLILSGSELADLLEAQKMIERAAVSRLITNACEVPERLGTLLDSFAGGPAMRSDALEVGEQFLAGVVELSGNSVLPVLYDSLRGLILAGHRHNSLTDFSAKAMVALCREVLKAVEEGDLSAGLGSLARIHDALDGTLVVEEAGA